MCGQGRIARCTGSTSSCACELSQQGCTKTSPRCREAAARCATLLVLRSPATLSTEVAALARSSSASMEAKTLPTGRPPYFTERAGPMPPTRTATSAKSATHAAPKERASPMPRARRAASAKSTTQATPTASFDAVTGFLAQPMLENLLPVMSIDDIGRLAQCSTQLKSIMATAEFSACAQRALGPIKELLARAHALVTGLATSWDVWLWDPPRGDPVCGGDPDARGEPIEHGNVGLEGAWVRNLVSFLEGSPKRVDWQYDVADYDDENVRRGSSRLAPANSRTGILKRIKALEETAPFHIYKGVRHILRILFTFGFKGQQVAWQHCVRFGLDGMLPLVLNPPRSSGPAPAAPPPPSGGGRKRRGAKALRAEALREAVPLPVVVLEVDDIISTGPPVFGFARYLRVDRNALILAAYLGHTNVLAAVVRMGATCSWDDEGTCFAFHTAIRHNRHDVVRCLCTPKASGGCGLELASLRRRDIRDNAWPMLMEDIDRLQYQVIWLGPDFDPDELGCEGSRGRRRIRSGYVWLQVVEMIRLLAELGMPARNFLPRVSAEKIEEIKADKNATGRLDFSGLPKQELRALMSLSAANGEYNGQFEDEGEMLDLTQFHAWLRGLWPSGTTTAGAADEAAESEDESEGESEGENEGEMDEDDSDDGGFADGGYGWGSF